MNALSVNLVIEDKGEITSKSFSYFCRIYKQYCIYNS